MIYLTDSVGNRISKTFSTMERELVQVGFKVSIEIHCETEDEIMSHLYVIRDEYKRHLRKRRGVIEDGAGLQWEDDNCYGSHAVTIKPEML